MASTDGNEVYSFPEMSGNIYPAGGSQTAVVYAQDVEIIVRYNWHKEFYQNTGQSTAQRTHYSLVEKDVQVSIGKLFTGPLLFQAFNSATGFNLDLFWGQTALGFTTAHFNIWSAAMQEYHLAGREGEVFEQKITFLAADISGV